MMKTFFRDFQNVITVTESGTEAGTGYPGFDLRIGKKYNFFLFAAWVAFAATTAVFMGPGWLWRAPGVQKRSGDRKTMTYRWFCDHFCAGRGHSEWWCVTWKIPD